MNARERIRGSRGWVFDLDGTLTLPVHDFPAIREALGVPEGIDILGHLSAVPAERSVELRRRLNDIEEGLAARTEASPGALRLVAALHREGLPLGIVTRNTRENALRTLEIIGIGGYFRPEAVVGRDEAEPKPSADGILQLSTLWGVPSQRMVMVGDYLFDLEAGRRAGTLTVHLERGETPRWPQLADLVVPDLERLAEVIGA